MKSAVRKFVMAFAIGSLALGASLSQANQTLALPINIRANVTATISAKILDNPNANPNPSVTRRTLLIQHGLAHNSNTALSLVASIFATPALSAKVEKVVLLDLPGRLGSTLPTGMLFGDLTMVDYGNVLVQSLYELEDNGVYVDSLLGHSMGGGIITIAQNQLLAANTSLYNEFGIDNVDLLAASPPREVPWIVGGTGGPGTVLAASNAQYSSQLGSYISVIPLLFQQLFFSNTLLMTPPNTPSLSTITNTYSAIEPYVATSELIGALGFQRPSVVANAFAPAYGTNVRVTAHHEDKNIFPFEQQALYRYLSGDNTDSKFTVVQDVRSTGILFLTADYSCHDMYIVNPQALLDQGMLSDL